MKSLESRINELQAEFNGRGFPTIGQLKVMLKAEGYPKAIIEGWFVSRE